MLPLEGAKTVMNKVQLEEEEQEEEEEALCTLWRFHVKHIK